MVDTSKIHALIAQARRRMRLQAALSGATTASILASAAALVVIYAVRQQALSEGAGVALLLGCAGIVAAGALIGALGRIPQHIVAARIDRASDLADRLSSACAFERALGPGGRAADEQTTALMRAAIRDAVAAAPRANIKAATPFQAPRDLRAALAFAVMCGLVAGLSWPEAGQAGPIAGPLDTAPPRPGDARDRPERFVDEDIEYARELLEDLRRVARAEREAHLDRFVDEIEALLARADAGEINKQQLLEELARAEQRYMEGADDDMEQAMADLRETGKELAKNQLTRSLGQALQQGDLEKAQKELEKLADTLDSSELSERQRQALARSLERAADQFEKRQEQREERLDQQIARQEEELRRLQRKHDEAKSEEEKRRLNRQKEEQERKLKHLEREKEQQQAENQRSLKRLHRNMKQASKELRQDQQDPQSQQQQQRVASRSLRNAAEDTGKVDADRRKQATQKKVASQMNDLREAMRRARRQDRSGMRDMFGKNRRAQDFRRRARGQSGSRSAWRPGQGQQQGKGQQGQGQGQQGQQGQGQQGQGQPYGDGHDPYVLGDATPKSGNTTDESMSGVHGRGPSRRETVLSAAQKGFASRAYEEVYAEYKTIVEEVMRAEKVPSGYKYYVKRYFQKIKPHAMD